MCPSIAVKVIGGAIVYKKRSFIDNRGIFWSLYPFFGLQGLKLKMPYISLVKTLMRTIIL